MAKDVNGREINTTNYNHNTEPNLNELHRAMTTKYTKGSLLL
jgi:hypothetical protein